MIPKQLEEANSRPDFSYRKKSKNQIIFYNSVLNRVGILCIALLVSMGMNAQTGNVEPDCPVEPPSSVIDNIEEASGYDLVYAFSVPDTQGGFTGNVEYVVDNSDMEADCIKRVAYLVLKDNRWIWVSMDAFTDDLTQLGLPEKDVEGKEFVFQQTVNNLNVIVDDNSIVQNTGIIPEGNIEIWPYGYGPESTDPDLNAFDDQYDWGDTYNESQCFGSFQVHDYANQEVLFAVNAWKNNVGYFPSLGIGNNPTEADFDPNEGQNDIDWTFTGNSRYLNVRCVYIFVSSDSGSEVPECAIIATEEVHLHGDNNVIAGNVCVTDEDGEIKLHDNSHVDGAVKADDLDIDDDSSAGSEMTMPADVETPPFYFNTVSNDDSPDIVVDEDEILELDGQVYGKIEVKEGGCLTFTAMNIFIDELKNDKNTKIKFADCANLFINKNVELDEFTEFNLDMKNVTLYIDDHFVAKKGSNVSAHIYVNDHEIKAEGDDDKPTYMKGLFVAKKVEGKNHVTWEGNAYCNPCPIEIPPSTAECDCKGGMTEVTIEYAGGAGASISSNSGTVTDNGDGTYTIYDNGEKLEKNLEIYVGGNTAEVHTSCSQDVLGVTFAGSITVIGYVDTEGNVTTLEGCPVVEEYDCECKGGMVSVTFAYMGSETLTSNSGTITNNGDGTYTVATSNGDKLEKDLEIYVGGNTAEYHTSCSQDILGVTMAGVTVVSYIDTEGNMTSLDGCSQVPIQDCECDGGIVEVTFTYAGELSDLSTDDSDATITDNGDGSFTITSNNGEKLSNPEIYVNGISAGELHASCSQNLLEESYGQGIVVVEYVDEEGSVISIETCPFDPPGQDCECDGGIVSVTFEYEGELSDLSSDDDEASITDNGDGTFTIASNDGDKLSNPQMSVNGSEVGELHASCSQNLLGLILGDLTVVSYIDKEGGVISLETCPAECECSGGLIEVTFAYDGAGVPSSNSGSVTDNEDGTYTVYDNGLKLEKDLEIYTNQGTAEIHTSCSQDVLGITFGGGVTVVGHVDSEGSVCSIPHDGGVKRQAAATARGEVSVKDEVSIELPEVGFAVKSWPNPSKESFNIRISSDNTFDTIKVQVFDITGKTVHLDSMNANTAYVFGEKLGSGLYFVKVSQGNNVKTLKLMKY